MEDNSPGDEISPVFEQRRVLLEEYRPEYDIGSTTHSQGQPARPGQSFPQEPESQRGAARGDDSTVDV
ncbi:hypothetical protein FMEXI_5527 [Fusarium mexicanum]|uniref:Uncharacterized protein n=1 Tax=Fusarium mexicanum TaxID=751941 RepID=A0A8H5MZZ8_9HYPO|nr:hypothetical protein FMEXI_5527 [Fusarium mexicanum]